MNTKQGEFNYIAQVKIVPQKHNTKKTAKISLVDKESRIIKTGI